MNRTSRRPLSLDSLRSFDAVARRLSFSAAADELHLSQPAISRQIKGLEDELGASLFNRGTRRVELTGAGLALLRSVQPWLAQLDASVRQIRRLRSRSQISLSTFASFATLWLMPRLADFERAHPQLDIRIAATDRLVEPDDPELDLALRHCQPGRGAAGATRLFGEVLTPVVSASLAESVARGAAPPLCRPADLAGHTLLEMDDSSANAAALAWPAWLGPHGLDSLVPKRWISTNFTHQQVQAALAGQGVALARLPMVHQALSSGDLVEPFGLAGRLRANSAYWLLPLGGPVSTELRSFTDWILEQARQTRLAIGEDALAAAPAPT